MLAEVALEDRDGISIAHIRGEVDMSNARELRHALQDAVEQVSAGLVVDFSETGYLDSAGLHFVFELGRRLRDRGQRLELAVAPGSSVESVLEMVGVEALAPISPTIDAAVARLRAHKADIPEL